YREEYFLRTFKLLFCKRLHGNLNNRNTNISFFCKIVITVKNVCTSKILYGHRIQSKLSVNYCYILTNSLSILTRVLLLINNSLELVGTMTSSVLNVIMRTFVSKRDFTAASGHSVMWHTEHD
ncbi:hypothetical protein SFRURICE_000323, partial [Spodoptera frugiperda]